MIARLILAAAAAAAVGVAASGPASALGVPKNCDSVKARGHTWAVQQRGLTCTTARSIVKKVASMPWTPATRPRYPGTYGGLRCVASELHASKSQGRRVISCFNASGTKAVMAGAPL